MKSKEKNFVSAVIYVHNAEKNIGVFLKTIIHMMETNFEHSEIICVNDYSDDAGASVIKSTGQTARTTSVSMVNMSYFHGLELAMDAGVDMAIGDFVFEFDNTYLDFDPSMIMEIYFHSLKGYDIVSASANRKERLTSKIFYKVFEKFADQAYRMSTESFRILSRRVINRVGAMNKTIPYRKVVYAGCGLKTDHIKYPVTEKKNRSADKKEERYRRGLAVNSLILFTDLGYRFSMSMTVIMMLISVFMTFYSLAAYVIFHPVEGWTTTILFLSITFFSLFGILTIIVKYLQLLVNMVFRRRHYSFESIEKLTK